MKKFTLLAAVFMMGLTVTTPDSNARGRQEGATPSTPARPTANRPGSTGNVQAAPPRPSTPNNTSKNPSTNPPRPGSTPGSSTTVTPPRPSTPNNTSKNPGGNPPRPGNNPGYNPGGNPPKPGGYNPPKPGGYNPPPKPGASTVPPRPNGYNPHYNYTPPRPHTPPSYYYFRPTPPPSWSISTASPNFGTILGIALGSMLSNSINTLFNNGYSVTGYTNNAVYLSNVYYCNVTWPEATMYYNNGFLNGSLFSASSYTYDPSRYNYVYNYLTSHYGMPISSQSLSNGGMSCTWWGNNNTYMTLSFYPEYSYGSTRYYTTLSTGY